MSKTYQIVLAILGLALLVLFVYYFTNIVIYIVVSAVLSLFGHPVIRWLDKVKIRKFRLPHTLNSFIALILIVGVFVGFIWFFVPLVSKQARVISSINMQEVVEYFRQPMEHFQDFLIRYDIIAADQTIQSILEQQISSFVNLTTFSHLFENLLSATGSFFIGVFSILFLTFFFLKEDKMLPHFIILILPARYEEEVKHIMSKVHYLLSRYFIGLLTELVSMITLISIGLTIFGVKNALLIGFLGGLMNIIPYLGPVIGATMGVLIGITSALSYGLYDQVLLYIVEIIGVFLGANLIDNILLQPLIYSSSVKAHPVEIFLVIIIAGSMAGVVGMIIAIPSYTILRVIAKEFLSKTRLVRALTKDI